MRVLVGFRIGNSAVMRRRVAQAQTDQGGRCLSVASLARPRLGRATQLTRAKRGATNPARLLFAYFLLAKQEKVSRPPGRDPAPARSRAQNPTRIQLIPA